MKTMTCNQLGGACNVEFQAETFNEMAELSRNHCMEKVQSGDKDHLKAMDSMSKMPQEDMQKWFEEKKKEFEEE